MKGPSSTTIPEVPQNDEKTPPDRHGISGQNHDLNRHKDNNGTVRSNVTILYDDIQEALTRPTYVIIDENQRDLISPEPEIASGSYHGAYQQQQKADCSWLNLQYAYEKGTTDHFMAHTPLPEGVHASSTLHMCDEGIQIENLPPDRETRHHSAVTTASDGIQESGRVSQSVSSSHGSNGKHVDTMDTKSTEFHEPSTLKFDSRTPETATVAATAAISRPEINLTEPYGSEKHRETPELFQPVKDHHEELDSFKDRIIDHKDHPPDFNTMKHPAPYVHLTDFQSTGPFIKSAEDTAIRTRGEAKTLSVGLHSAKTLYGELSIIETPAVTTTGPHLERVHPERVHTSTLSFKQSAIIKDPGDRDSSQYTYITDVLRPPELLKDSTEDSVMHLHQNAKLPPEPLRGTGLLASHIDPTVDMETPMWVSSNIKDAYTQVAKDALDTSIIIQQDSDYDSESELMDTVKDPQVRTYTSSDAVNGTAIRNQTSASQATWHVSQEHHSSATEVNSERVAQPVLFLATAGMQGHGTAQKAIHGKCGITSRSSAAYAREKSYTTKSVIKHLIRGEDLQFLNMETTTMA